MSDEPNNPPPSDPPPSDPPPSDPPSDPPPPPTDAPPPPPPPSDPSPPEPQQPAGSGAGGSNNRTLMIILSYFGPLALIPFLMEKDDRDIQWHSKHGLVLFGADIVISIVLTIISTVTSCVGCLVTLPVWIIVAVVHIICIVKGVNGERFLIPGLSDLADKF